MDPDQIERSLVTPHDIADPLLKHKDAQDAARGDWASPRAARQPSPPWPDENCPVLRYLLWKANESLDHGMDIRTALIQLAVHAWFEGGVENYDRGRRDGQAAD